MTCWGDDLRGATLRWQASYALSVALVIAAAMTAGCGFSTTSSSAGQNSNTDTSASSGQTSNTGAAGNSAATNGPAGMVRLGCGTYCQQAGGYGGGGTPNMTKILTTQVTALPDGTVPITVECLFQQPCRGALLLDSGDPSTDPVCQTPEAAGGQTAMVQATWGRSDLDVPAQTTRTLGVTLSPCAFGLLSQRGTLKVTVTADSGQTVAALSPAGRRGLIPVDGEFITVSAP
jgi:hypothetical protein